MNTRIKKLWLKALRSGEYKQTTGTLRRRSTEGEYTYCCLGVLERLMCDETGKRYPRKSILTPSTMKWAELDSLDPQLGKHSASWLNDGDSLSNVKPKSFKQ